MIGSDLPISSRADDYFCCCGAPVRPPFDPEAPVRPSAGNGWRPNPESHKPSKMPVNRSKGLRNAPYTSLHARPVKPTMLKHIVVGIPFAAALLLVLGTGAAQAQGASLTTDAPASLGLGTHLQGRRSRPRAVQAEQRGLRKRRIPPARRGVPLQAFPDGPDRVKLIWQIADGYYLYRTRIKAATTSDQAQLGALDMPKGETKTDEYFGKQEIYHHQLVVGVPVARASAAELTGAAESHLSGLRPRRPVLPADHQRNHGDLCRRGNCRLARSGRVKSATPRVVSSGGGASGAGATSDAVPRMPATSAPKRARAPQRPLAPASSPSRTASPRSSPRATSF